MPSRVLRDRGLLLAVACSLVVGACSTSSGRIATDAAGERDPATAVPNDPPRAPTEPAPTLVPTSTPAPTPTPQPTATPEPFVPPNVLLVGDSTLLAVESYGAESSLAGFFPTLEVASCRTLGVPSCGQPPVPPNSVATIESATGPFDGVVIMAGYDEWWTTFPDSAATVLRVSRAAGAKWILWLTYPEGVPYALPDGRSANEAFINNNQVLRDLAADPANADLILADWGTYSRRTNGWITDDGIHLDPVGAFGLGDYISRWVAHLNGVRCPVPATLGEIGDTPCAGPDDLARIPDVAALYRLNPS